MILNQWYAIAPSSEVKKNNISAIRRCGLDLALWRNDKGELGCVVDLCSHRHVKLSLGELKNDCLMCPFHGLKFAADGSCKFVPSIGKGFQNNIDRFNVKAYKVKEAHGIIYLFYGDFDLAPDNLPFFNDIDDTWAYSEILDIWDTHYSRAIENQLDVLHLPFIHRKTIGRGNKTLVNGPKVVFEDETLRTSASNAVDIGQKPLTSEECEVSDKIHLRFKFPNLWMNHISEKIRIIIYFAPVDDEQTHMYIRFYTKQTPFKIVNRLIAQVGAFANRKIEEEDKRVVVTHSPKLSSFKSDEQLLPGDRPIIIYRQMREKLKNNLQHIIILKEKD